MTAGSACLDKGAVGSLLAQAQHRETQGPRGFGAPTATPGSCLSYRAVPQPNQLVLVALAATHIENCQKSSPSSSLGSSHFALHMCDFYD